MILYEEIYFDITFTGEKSRLKKLHRALCSGLLDGYFELNDDMLSYDDGFDELGDSSTSHLFMCVDDYGIEIDELDVEELLSVIAEEAVALDYSGRFYDAEENEFCFMSDAGERDFVNMRNSSLFNDELDDAANEEDSYE